LCRGLINHKILGRTKKYKYNKINFKVSFLKPRNPNPYRVPAKSLATNWCAFQILQNKGKHSSPNLNCSLIIVDLVIVIQMNQGSKFTFIVKQ